MAPTRLTDAQIIQVALPVPRGETYDYLCPMPVEIGSRVRVPFGSRRLTGLVVALQGASSLSPCALKPVLEVLDDSPLVGPAWLDLVSFAARYYQSPLGMAIATALPASLRQGKLAQPSRQRLWRPTAAGQCVDLAELARAPRQASALAALQSARAPLPATAIGPEGCAASVLQALAGKGLVEPVTASLISDQSELAATTLNPDQSAAVEAVLGGSGFRCHLLDGVTGSGKTEVYLALARNIIESGRQVLLLVPEIGLTPQMVERVRTRTGARIVALHSGLSDGERHNAWLAAASGEADIVLGTRSAVFVPLARPGLVIVDEEHDGSYKQQDGMRYHARDLAVRRAQQHDIAIILGSATPSLESHAHTLSGRYQALHLGQRHGRAKPPRLRTIDLRGQDCRHGLSGPLIQATRSHLEAGRQVLLFVNRRGFSPILLCHDCGWTAQCERCDARLISHQRHNSLRCHHCGHSRALPAHCPDCGSHALQHLGQGTERIEQEVARLWPQVPRIRLDRDATARKGVLEEALERIRTGDVQLIIGTQMLAKGHDFPALSLVGIIDADQGLYGQDFRASEHLAQLLVQVAGRAGRRDEPGEVLVQTHNPDHPLLRHLAPGHYRQIADMLLDERRQTGWPPFARLALIRAEAREARQALNVLQMLVQQLGSPQGIEVLGPVPAVMERRQGRYRYQLLLRSQDRGRLQACLRSLRTRLESEPAAQRLRWSIDVDPQTLD